MPGTKGGKGAFAPSSLQMEYGEHGSEASEAKGKPRPARNSRDKGIWTVPDSEKPKKAKQVKKTKKLSKDEEAEDQVPERYLENQIYETSLQNWTLPRVELWCRDPRCKFNLELWGDQYQHHQHQSHHPHQHPHPHLQHPHLQHQHLHSPALHSVPYNYNYNLRDQVSAGPSSSGVLVNTHTYSQDNSISSVPMPTMMNSSSTKGPGASGNMHMNMSMNINNLNKKEKEKEGPMIPKSDLSSPLMKKANPQQMDTMTTSDNNETPPNSSAENKTNSVGSSIRSGATSTELGSTTSTTTTGFESNSGSTNSNSKSESSGKSLTRSDRLSMIYAPTNNYPSIPFVQPTTTNPFCPSCNGVVPLNHLEPIQEVAPLKADSGFWNFNQFNHPHPLQRDHSFHSFGGFTLNGQYNTQAKKHNVVKFCSSHKIALVVSTFSLLVTIGLVITLLLMKKKGMMET